MPIAAVVAASLVSWPAELQGQDRLLLNHSFPRQEYTPFGYIDNPYHSMVFNRSGVLRSLPPLGFGWWRTEFEGNYGGGVRDHVNYYSLLQMSVGVGDELYAHAEDFSRHGIALTSSYHSKNCFSYDFSASSVNVSFLYFLASENTLACQATFSNSGESPRTMTIYATEIYGIGETKWWGSDGLTARMLIGDDVTASKIYAYGDCFVLGSTLKSRAVYCTDSRESSEHWIRTRDTTSARAVSLRGGGPLFATLTYRFALPPKSEFSALFLLSRGKNEQEALREHARARHEAPASLARKLEEDDVFWRACPVLQGDWPPEWKRGWVYDFETLRMNVRSPLGIFHHHWDGMQIHSPRSVLGETSLDMMTLGYGDPALAKEVLLGIFEDALAPNVPCAREDGSVNMISSDGSECGTAPMWGYPFRVIRAIYATTGDRSWITRLYPRLKAYIEWWLRFRTDAEGYLHCNNSWESGQDGSKRFLVSEGNEAAVADFIRTVDVEASMCEAMEIMEQFASVAGFPDEIARWRDLAERRRQNVAEMFVDGWYRDIDGRTNTPIVLAGDCDVAMLAPLACNVAAREVFRALAPEFDSFPEKMRRSLEWPPAMQTFTEAAWNAGQRMTAARLVQRTADRVYHRTDARSPSFGDSLGSRIPGVANEFWPERDVPPGGENYGWGATLPMHIIRSIVGFHETSSDSEFTVAPSLPSDMAHEGKTYTIEHLNYRGRSFTVSYTCLKGVALRVRVSPSSPGAMSVTDTHGRALPSEEVREGLVFPGENGGIYRVHCR